MYVIFNANDGYLAKDGHFGFLDDALVVEDYQKALQLALEQAALSEKTHDPGVKRS